MDFRLPGFPVHLQLRSLLKLMSIELVMPSKHLILRHPLLLLPSVFSNIRVFLMSQFFASGGQSIGASALVLPMNNQDWFSLGWTGWISLQSKGLPRVFSNTTAQKHQFFGAQLSLWSSYHLRRQRHEQWKIDHRIKYPTSRWNPHLSHSQPQNVPLPPLQSIIPSYLLPEPQCHSLQGLTFQNSTPGVTSSCPASTLCLQIV